MLPGVKNLKIYQNSDFVFIFKLQDKDLSGYLAKMQIRDQNNSSLLLELTTENEKIEISEDNSVTVSISSSETAILENGVYDLFLISGGKNYPYLMGNITVIPSVTR